MDLTGGLRYTKDKKSGFLFNENLFHVSLDDQLTNAEKWDNLSYLLTLNYRVHDDMNVYFTPFHWLQRRRLQCPRRLRFRVRPAGGGGGDQQLGAWPEDGMWNNRLRTNVAAYRAKFKDIQIAQFEAGSGGASSRLVNAGDTTNWGVEVDAVAVLAEGLIADLSYGYLNTKFNTYLARNPATEPRSGHRRRDHPWAAFQSTRRTSACRMSSSRLPSAPCPPASGPPTGGT